MYRKESYNGFYMRQVAHIPSFRTFANRPAPETSRPERRRRINESILPLVIHRIHSRRIRKCQSDSIPHNLPPRSHSYTTTSTYGEWSPEIHWLGADSQIGRCRGRCKGVVWRADTAYVEGGTQCGLYVLDIRGGRFQACLRCLRSIRGLGFRHTYIHIVHLYTPSHTRMQPSQCRLKH